MLTPRPIDFYAKPASCLTESDPNRGMAIEACRDGGGGGRPAAVAQPGFSLQLSLQGVFLGSEATPEVGQG